MRITLGEVFDQLRKLPTNDKKVAHLRQHAGPGVFYILKLAFNKPTWLLPDGCPPFKQDPGTPGLTPSHLMKELRTLYLFFDGGHNGLTQLRREKLFQSMLERISAVENELILSVKDGSFDKTYKCSKKLVDDAFPGLLKTPFTTKFLRG
jgi:hypothetical protein